MLRVGIGDEVIVNSSEGWFEQSKTSWDVTKLLLKAIGANESVFTTGGLPCRAERAIAWATNTDSDWYQPSSATYPSPAYTGVERDCLRGGLTKRFVLVWVALHEADKKVLQTLRVHLATESVSIPKDLGVSRGGMETTTEDAGNEPAAICHMRSDLGQLAHPVGGRGKRAKQ